MDRLTELSEEGLGVTWTYTVLHSRVLAVAVKGAINDWAAYIGPVSGHDHMIEAEEVYRSGTKLPYLVAKVLFPSMDRAYRWRS